MKRFLPAGFFPFYLQRRKRFGRGKRFLFQVENPAVQPTESFLPERSASLLSSLEALPLCWRWIEALRSGLSALPRPDQKRHSSGLGRFPLGYQSEALPPLPIPGLKRFPSCQPKRFGPKAMKKRFGPLAPPAGIASPGGALRFAFYLQKPKRFNSRRSFVPGFRGQRFFLLS